MSSNIQKNSVITKIALCIPLVLCGCASSKQEAASATTTVVPQATKADAQYTASQFELVQLSNDITETGNPFDYIALYDADGNAVELISTAEPTDSSNPMEYAYDGDEYSADVSYKNITKNDDNIQLSINFTVMITDEITGEKTGYVKKITFNINNEVLKPETTTNEAASKKTTTAESTKGSSATSSKSSTSSNGISNSSSSSSKSSSSSSGSGGTTSSSNTTNNKSNTSSSNKNSAASNTTNSSSSSTANKNNTSNTTSSNSSSSNSSSSSKTQSCTTVHHDAEGYYETVTVVDKEAYDEQVLVTAAYDERVRTKRFEVCSVCGLEIVENADGSCPDMDTHLVFAHGDVGGGYSVRDEYTTVHHDATYKTVHHDAVTHTEQVWKETKAAYDENVCS